MGEWYRKVDEMEGTMEKSREGKIEKVGKGKEKIERWWGGGGGKAIAKMFTLAPDQKR